MYNAETANEDLFFKANAKNENKKFLKFDATRHWLEKKLLQLF